MPSPLVFYALHLNHICNKFLLVTYPLYWNTQRDKWEYLFAITKNNPTTFAYYLITFGLLGGVAVPLSLGLLFHRVFISELLYLHEIVFVVLLGFNIQLSLMYDCLLMKYGNGLANYVNWIISTDCTTKTNFSLVQLILKLQQVMIDGSDPIGVSLISLVTSYWCASYMVPCVVVWLKCDVFYLWGKIFGVAEIMEEWVVVAIRFVLYLFGSQLAFTNLRTFTLIMIIMGLSTVSFLKRICFVKLQQWSMGSVFLFKRFYIAWMSIENLLGLFSQVYSGLTCVILVIGTNTFIFGLKKGHLYIFAVALSITLVVLVIVLFSLQNACLFCNMNDTLFLGWKRQMVKWSGKGAWDNGCRGFQSGYVKRSIKGCKSCSFKIIGLNLAVDKVFRLSYLDTILSYIINVLVALNENVLHKFKDKEAFEFSTIFRVLTRF